MAKITNRTEQWEGHTGLEVETFLKQELETLDQTVSNASVSITAIQGSVALLTEDVTKLNALVINDLTTGGADKALSAEMGKKLNEAIQKNTEKNAEQEEKLTELESYHVILTQEEYDALEVKEDKLYFTYEEE